MEAGAGISLSGKQQCFGFRTKDPSSTCGKSELMRLPSDIGG
jgi:hypothetical protein